MAAHDTDEIVINITIPENWQGAAVLSAPRVEKKILREIICIYYSVESSPNFKKTPSRSWTKKGISQSKGVWR